jgi:hypothetical protein
MPFLFEAWVHTPEVPVPLDAPIQETCTQLFYGTRQQAEESPVLPLGFSEFLTRVQAHNATHPPHPILHKQAVAFYNRQTIVQIFFRIPASQHKAPSVYLHDPKGEFPKRKISLKSVRLDRPKEPFHEMQFIRL